MGATHASSHRGARGAICRGASHRSAVATHGGGGTVALLLHRIARGRSTEAANGGGSSVALLLRRIPLLGGAVALLRSTVAAHGSAHRSTARSHRRLARSAHITTHWSRGSLLQL